jgi:ABC-2 type transport system permease protein
MEKDLADQKEIEARLQRKRAELMQRHNATSLDAVPVNFSGISMQEGEEHGNEVFDKHYGRLFAIYEQQNRVQLLAGVAAPLLPVRSLSMGLAGTDFAHHREFVRAAEEHRRLIQRLMNGDIAENSRPGVVYTAGSELWEKVPDFRYDAPSAGWVLGSSGLSLGLAGAWLLGAIAFAVTGATRGGVD